MSDDRPSLTGRDAAGAGMLMLAVNALGAGAGVGLGALVGAPVPGLLVGFFVGFFAAIRVVAKRFRAM
ncbi:MAG TPA: hypothetical protein VG388_00960 [Solirubrobacteraceae bacterium]|nr:hypothetical protein [Solirubrobacteraceae bacterium]